MIVSSIHISTEWGKHGILMDAGEGTLGQLYRLHGKDLDKVCLWNNNVILGF